MDRVMRMLKTKYATFEGRARRKEYWYFVLFQAIALTLAAVVDGILFGRYARGLVYTVVALGLLAPGLAVSFRRMHDIDRSAWWLLLVLIPIVGAIILIWWAAQPGTRGDNRFGPDPIAEEEGGLADPAAVI
jgi:uncharacterized membrane protein YhaH (DUF805 family)